MANRQAGCAAGETAIGQECTHFAEAFGFEVRSRVQHFLHPGTATWTLITNDDNVARLDLVSENRLNDTVLAFENPRRTREFQDAFIDTRGFDYTAVHCNIAEQ